MPYDPLLAVFGEDPEALKEFERIKALRGDVSKAQRLQRLGAVGALATDQALQGFGQNLYRTGSAQEAENREAMAQGYEGLKQTRSKAAERAEEKAWREQQRADQEAYRKQTLGLQYAQLAAQERARAESNAIRRAAQERAGAAAQSAKEARDLAAGAKLRQERQGVSRSVASAEENLRTLDQALTHPGRQAATGASGFIASKLPFTEARNFQSLHNKLVGGAFLQAFESLKGGGQITEIEGKKATDAITRINTPGLTEDEYQMALEELRNVVSTGLDRAKQEGYDIGMYRDLPGLPSGNPAAQGGQGNFGMPAQPAGSAARRWLDQVGG